MRQIRRPHDIGIAHVMMRVMRVMVVRSRSPHVHQRGQRRRRRWWRRQVRRVTHVCRGGEEVFALDGGVGVGGGVQDGGGVVARFAVFDQDGDGDSARGGAL